MSSDSKLRETWFRVYSREIQGHILQRLGSSLGLLLLLRDKVTQQQNDLCIVSGGKPILDREWAGLLGVSTFTVRRYRKILETNGYIYNLNVYGNLSIWSVLGYHKWNSDTKHSTRISNLVQRIENNVAKDIYNGLIIPTNPFFNIGVNQIYPELKSSKFSHNSDKVDFKESKIAMSNKEKTREKTIERTREKINDKIINIETGTFEAVNASYTASDLHDDIVNVYGYYMKSIGSNKHIPDDKVYSLIEAILIDESVSILKNCIDNYIDKVLSRKDWSYLLPENFFDGNTYIRFLSKTDEIRYEPRNKPIVPGERIS